MFLTFKIVKIIIFKFHVENMYRKHVSISGNPCVLEILDTAGKLKLTNEQQIIVFKVKKSIVQCVINIFEQVKAF